MSFSKYLIGKVRGLARFLFTIYSIHQIIEVHCSVLKIQVVANVHSHVSFNYKCFCSFLLFINTIVIVQAFDLVISARLSVTKSITCFDSFSLLELRKCNSQRSIESQSKRQS